MPRRQAPRARTAAAARQARITMPAGPAPRCTQDTPPGTCRASSDTVLAFPTRRQSGRPSGVSCFDGVPLTRRPGQAMTPGGTRSSGIYPGRYLGAGCWPRRFLTDPDADAALRLFGQDASGKALALMARFARPGQPEPRLAGDAIRRIGGTGTVIRTQAPLIGSVSVWAATWRTQVRIGMVPDAMVIETVTSLSGKFVVPLA
jgi:hypothetical protein